MTEKEFMEGKQSILDTDNNGVVYNYIFSLSLKFD